MQYSHWCSALMRNAILSHVDAPHMRRRYGQYAHTASMEVDTVRELFVQDHDFLRGSHTKRDQEDPRVR